MKTLEWTTIDKSGWGSGPWQTEVDKRQWLDEATGLPCLIVRNRGGALCGYVGVPTTHPWHGKDYGVVDADVHGGLTFAKACTPMTPAAYEQMRARIEGGRDEDLREWGPVLGSYEVWLAHARDRFICHLPEPGEPDDVWWFGFDCAHSGDCSPGYRSVAPILAEGRYRDIAYVTRECAELARQLTAGCAGPPNATKET